MKCKGEGLRFPWDEPPAPGQAIEIAEGLLWLRLPLPMALDHVNIYALDEGDSWSLIDCGLDWRTGRDAMQACLDGPLAGKPVGRVVLTHHHPDHVGLAGWFAHRNARIFATRLGWSLTRMLQLDHQDFPPAEQLIFRRRAGMAPDDLAAFSKETPFNFSTCTAPIPLGFHAIFDGDTIEMGGRSWLIRFGHGHAPDHATFWGDEIVLAGDQIIADISSHIGVYPSEPEADPLREWLASCHHLHHVAGDGDPLVLPGHKRPFYGIGNRLEQLIRHHELTLTRLRNALAEGPRTAVGCFGPIYRRAIPPRSFGLALSEAVAHLNYLYCAGETERNLGADGAWHFTLKKEI